MSEKMRKRIAVLLSALVLAGILCACGEPVMEEEEEPIEFDVSDTVSGETLTAGSAADNAFTLCIDNSKSRNPITTKSTLNQTVGGLVYDLLFEVDENFNVSSRILSDWYMSETGTWVLTPREDIPMHDGTMLSVDDIVYSISRVYSQGATYYQQRMGRVYSSAYNGVVYISTDSPRGLQLTRMAVPIIKEGSILEDMPIGSGPYMYDQEDLTRLNKFEQYENAELLPFDTVWLREYTGMESMISDYESGRIDLVVNDPTSIYNMGYGGKNEKRDFATTNMHYLGFNNESDFFCYEQFRHALNWIIDREGIVESALDGNGTASALPIHPNSAQFDATYNNNLLYDPARCLAELEKLGCRDLDGDGELEFTLSGSKVDIRIEFLVCADTASKVLAARKIAADMESIGIPVHLRELSWEQYKEILTTGKLGKDEVKFDMYYAETAIAPDWDTRDLFAKVKADENVTNLNFGRWVDAEAEDVVEKFLEANDETREEARNAMLDVLTQKSLFLPVCFEKREVITHLGVIGGITPNQYDVFHNITNWKTYLD